jgi:hypothetical protein
MLRLDGEKITSVFGLRLMNEVNRTLELDPTHVTPWPRRATRCASRRLGGDAKEGERLLREVVRRRERVYLRITLATSRPGAIATRPSSSPPALQIATQGRADKTAEAEHPSAGATKP